MNWDDYEKARFSNFTTIRGEWTTGCLECGAQIRGTDEKMLEKRRRQHAVLHLSRSLYLKAQLDGFDPAKLPEQVEKMRAGLAHAFYDDFRAYIRFLLDREEIMRRLTVSQKGHLDFVLGHERWEHLNQEERAGFYKAADDFIEVVFPELKADSNTS